MQWAAVDTYLKLARLPFDAAIRMFPDGGTGVKPAAQAAVDGADTGIRAIVATVLGDPGSVDDATGRRRQQAAPPERPTAGADPPPVPPAPHAAPGGRVRAAAMTGTAGRTARSAGSASRSRAADIVTAEDQAVPASADGVFSEPSHEEIAARAYELYQRGVPGDAKSHWEAAKRELTSAPR